MSDREVAGIVLGGVCLLAGVILFSAVTRDDPRHKLAKCAKTDHVVLVKDTLYPVWDCSNADQSDAKTGGQS